MGRAKYVTKAKIHNSISTADDVVSTYTVSYDSFGIKEVNYTSNSSLTFSVPSSTSPFPLNMVPSRILSLRPSE